MFWFYWVTRIQPDRDVVQLFSPTLGRQPQFGAIKRATIPLPYCMVQPSAEIRASNLHNGTVMADVWELEKKDRGRFARLLHYWAKDPITSKVTTFSRAFTLLTRLLDNPIFRMMQQVVRDTALGAHALMVGREGLAIPGVQLQRQWISDTFDPKSHKTYVMTVGERTLGYVQTQKMGNMLWIMALENAFWHRRSPNGLPIRFQNVYEGLLYTAMQQHQPTYLGWLPTDNRVGELHAQRYKRWLGGSEALLDNPVPQALQTMTAQLRQLATTTSPGHQTFVAHVVSQAREPGQLISQVDKAYFKAPVPLPAPHDVLPDSTDHPVPQTAAH